MGTNLKVNSEEPAKMSPNCTVEPGCLSVCLFLLVCLFVDVLRQGHYCFSHVRMLSRG